MVVIRRTASRSACEISRMCCEHGHPEHEIELVAGVEVANILRFEAAAPTHYPSAERR